MGRSLGSDPAASETATLRTEGMKQTRIAMTLGDAWQRCRRGFPVWDSCSAPVANEGRGTQGIAPR
jgi:hypothetical protein